MPDSSTWNLGPVIGLTGFAIVMLALVGGIAVGLYKQRREHR